MIKQSCTLFWENSGKNKKKKIIKMINNLIKKERDEKSTKPQDNGGYTWRIS